MISINFEVTLEVNRPHVRVLLAVADLLDDVVCRPRDLVANLHENRIHSYQNALLKKKEEILKLIS